MCPSITISDATFAKLQQIATPFVDTPESVISALIDEEIRRRDLGRPNPASAAAQNIARFEPDQHESLTHTRLISAAINGKDLDRPKWNNILDRVHLIGRERLGSFEALQRASGARLRQGRYEKEGFHFLSEGDFSIQGLDANLAWDHSLKLAKHLRIPIRVTFEWRDKDGAARRGQSASMEWVPPNLAIA